jgi:Zn-dependent protease
VGLRTPDLGLVALQLVVLLFSLSFHEMAHAWAAHRLGDATARLQGRLSLNPMVHLDLVGTILLPLVAALTGVPVIGWAVPVPVDTRNLRRPRRDHALIAAAGPASNVLLALAAALLLRVAAGGAHLLEIGAAGLAAGVFHLLAVFVVLNLLLAIFNLIPVPPLDGSWVLSSLLPPRLAHRLEALRPYGFVLIYILVLSPLWGGVISPLVQRASRLLL